MDDRAGLIEWHTSVNIQGEIWDTYDTTQDVATQGVFVLQPKIGKHSRFILRNRIAVDHYTSAYNPQDSEQLTYKDAGSRPTHPDA